MGYLNGSYDVSIPHVTGNSGHLWLYTWWSGRTADRKKQKRNCSYIQMTPHFLKSQTEMSDVLFQLNLGDIGTGQGGR